MISNSNGINNTGLFTFYHRLSRMLFFLFLHWNLSIRCSLWCATLAFNPSWITADFRAV
jgi:hypothetical protein